MKNIFALLIALALALASPVQADDFWVWGKNMNPLFDSTDDCLHKSPIRKCCTDNTASACSEEGCNVSGDCGVSPNLTCAVREGDSGRRCCTDGTAASCASPEVFCVVNGDCSGAGGGNTTCANKYSGGSEAEGTRWECTKTNSPELMFQHQTSGGITGICIGGANDGSACSTIADCSGGTICGHVATCQILYNTLAVSGTVRFSGRAVSLTDTGTPAITTFSKATVDDTVPTSPYWPAYSGNLVFAIEDGSSPGDFCNFENGECKNKIISYRIGITSGGTATSPIRIRFIHCSIP